ncbi:ankyrin, partial [Acephala macrosclerotiorum]
SPLVYAASEGLYFVVRNLIEVGAEVRLEDSGTDGRTALAAAANNGHPEIVKYLIGRGANCRVRDPMMDTPLALAAAQGHQEVVEVLLQAGVNPNSAALDGTTAAIIAASNGHASIVERLL